MWSNIWTCINYRAQSILHTSSAQLPQDLTPHCLANVEAWLYSWCSLHETRHPSFLYSLGLHYSTCLAHPLTAIEGATHHWFCRRLIQVIMHMCMDWRPAVGSVTWANVLNVMTKFADTALWITAVLELELQSQVYMHERSKWNFTSQDQGIPA